MKKMLGLVVVVPLLFGGLAACGGSDSGSSTTETTAAATPAETMAETTEPTAESGDSMSAVDAYCQKVDEYAAEAKKLIEDPTSGNASDLQAKAQELQDTASQLTQELIDDPSKAEQVQECTTKLQEALAG
ncbi:MAG: hypothetical protein H6526_08230 [Actinobacteria bacterium]|nr:hypothetical protein [Actinomycetota bacterium]MCB9415258.1 hypothetical protein [Actinomycetota bacterium]